MSRHSNTWLTFRLVSVCWLMLWAQFTLAQTTTFTYQGKLTDAGNPANGVYDLQFRLLDALAGGNPVGATIIREDVAASGGIFTVTLDFGAAAFPGANRWLEIGVRPGPSTGAFTPLSPLQPLTATPYAVQSLNAANATSAINATNAVNFSGALAGDVTGTQSATTLTNNSVTTAKLADGNITNAKIADVAGGKITGSITSATLPGANVAGAVANATNAATAVNFSGTLAGDVTGTQGATTVGKLQGRTVASTAPLGGQVLKFNSTTNQ